MPIRLEWLALAVAFLFCAAPAAASAPFTFDAAPGRLPKSVVPIDYRIAIVPDAQAKTLSGTETILLEVRKPVRTIVFNSLGERLQNVTLDGAPAAGVESDDATQLTTVTLAGDVPVGRHTLAFAYTGKLESAPQGLFVQRYRSGAATGTMLSTQFEATDARRMFPCWDEPAFRATFQLTVTVPAAWSVVSNMPVQTQSVSGATASTTFRRSPKMPTYLVEFSAGDLAHIDADAHGRHFAVWAVRGQEQLGSYALANAQQILADYNEYFGYRYPLPKLDSIAVPGGFGGAMENWGAITYNDQLLLLMPNAPFDQMQRVYSIQAHEMAHQWNGDLVTMGWWDDIWLNESFASWMAAKETALRNPSWKWWEHQDASKETAMNADARANSHAIEQHITTEMEAEASFDSEITYNKGAGVLAHAGGVPRREDVPRGDSGYIKARVLQRDQWRSVEGLVGRERARRGEDRGRLDDAAGLPAGRRARDVRRVGSAHDRARAEALPARRHRPQETTLEHPGGGAFGFDRRAAPRAVPDGRPAGRGRQMRRAAERKRRDGRVLPGQIRRRNAGDRSEILRRARR